MAEDIVNVPDFDSLDSFSVWVKNLEAEEIQSWKTKDWLAMYDKIEKYTSSSEFANVCKTEIPKMVEKGQLKGYGESLTGIANSWIASIPNSKNYLFTEMCGDSFEKLYRNFRFEPEQLKYIKKIAKEAGEKLANQGVDAAQLVIPTTEEGNFSKESLISNTTRKINNIAQNSTAYPEDSRVNTYIEINTNLTNASGDAGPISANTSKIRMNPNNLYDAAIAIGAHESAHINFQSQSPLQQNLLREDILAHPELGKDFQLLMEKNCLFYLQPDNIRRRYSQNQSVVGLFSPEELKKIWLKQFDGYKNEPMEKFSNIYGDEVERAFRHASGQGSERTAIKVVNFLETPIPPSLDGTQKVEIGNPEKVNYSNGDIVLTYKSYEHSPEDVMNAIKDRFKNADEKLLNDMNITLDKTFGEVKLTVPKGYDFSSRFNKFLTTPPPPPLPPLPSTNQNVVNNVNTVIEENLEPAADVTAKTTAAKAATTATEKGAKSGVIETIKAADDKVNTAIDKTIEKGSEKLNNTAVGKAYTKAEKAVANSTVGKAVNKGMQKVGGAVTKTVQKTGEAVAKTAAGKAVQKAAAKTVGKTAAKAVGKSVLKKIPLVSVGAGLVFGAQRAMAGDWKGAAGEVASGALGTFPGLGTAASVAIDAGLAGRDIYNETNKDGHNADSAQSKKSNTSLKKQLKTDAQKAKQYTTKQNSQKPQQHHTNTKSLMKTDAKNAANKYQHQMEALINSMNKVNGKNKAIDAEKTTEKLYQKYGDNAYALLQEAVQKPSSYINALNNNSIKTSSDVVNYLCNMENTQQNQQIIRHILSDRGR